MATKRSKRYNSARKLVPADKSHGLTEAIALLKTLPAPKFDQTVTLSMHTTADPRRSDQMVRGTCRLPHGSGKQVRVLVFAEGAAADAARAAGAEYVGFAEYVKQCQEGWTDFDVAISTPAAMSEVRKLGKVLGPRGLMPNPKTGTVTDDVATAIAEVKAGRVEFKLDRNGNISVPVGNLSFETTALEENSTAVLNSIVRAKAAAIRGRYLESLFVTATMSPSIKLDPAVYLK